MKEKEKKTYEVIVAITFANKMKIEADSVEQAERMAKNYVADDPFSYINDPEADFVECEIYDTEEISK